MKTLIFLGLLAIGYGSYAVIDDPLPSRLAGEQCADICKYDRYNDYSAEGQASTLCRIGSKTTTCQEYFQQ